jgi:iron complex transport system substrate-binding protein
MIPKLKMRFRLIQIFGLAVLTLSSVLQATELRAAERIISLAPHITEILYAVGAGDEIVGAVDYSDYPAAALDIPRIGSSDRINYEAIVALDPTLIFGWESGNGIESLNRLRELGLTVYSHNPETLGDVADSLKLFAELTGHSDMGEQQFRLFNERWQRLEQKYRHSKPLTVYYQIWNEPQMTVNGDHLISDVIELCGGVNPFADALPLIPRIGVESVIQADPEVIIAAGMAGERPVWLDDWNQWPSMVAVANERLFFVHPDLMHRHSPRILEGAEQVCQILDRAR